MASSPLNCTDYDNTFAIRSEYFKHRKEDHAIQVPMCRMPIVVIVNFVIKDAGSCLMKLKKVITIWKIMKLYKKYLDLWKKYRSWKRTFKDP